MKKIILPIIAAGVILSAAISPARAETSNADLIAQLQLQIQTLQTQINALIHARAAITVAAQNAAATLKLLIGLREGMSGEDVKLLQATLSVDANVYPEAIISGFFGPLTTKAVKRFQEKNGIEAIGQVGPKTLQKLNKILDDNPVAHEEHDGKTEHCAIIPPGHLIAPGWLRMHDNIRPVVPVCQNLPPGIQKQLGTISPPPPPAPDTTTPLFTALFAGDITTTNATVRWTTNEETRGKLYYATSPWNPMVTSVAFTAESEFATHHASTLNGLSASTTYYFMIAASDRAGNTATSSQTVFTTLSTGADTTSPVISGISTGNISVNSAVISWQTNERSRSKVYYSATSPVSVSSPSVSDASLVIDHRITVRDLSANTTYYFMVESSDATGNVSVSSQSSFTTQAPSDTTPPIISALLISSISTTSATVMWTTDENATSKVYYGPTFPFYLSGANSVSSSTLVSAHTIGLVGLTANTTYYFAVESKDASGNTATSSQQSFVTTQ